MKPLKDMPIYLKKPFRAKQVAKYHWDGTLLNIYPSVTIAARENNIKPGRLYSYISHPERIPRKEKRFLWKYIGLSEEES